MMTEQINQKISQYLDGDLERGDAVQLLKKMQLDAHLQVKLQRYIIAQQALRSAPAAMAENNLLSKVKQALEYEPLYLIPQPRQTKPFRKASLLALAASVAALAVIIPVWTKSTLVNPSAQQMLLVQQPAADAEPPERVRSSPVNQRFQDYLQAHNGSLYTNGTAKFQVQAQLAGFGQE